MMILGWIFSMGYRLEHNAERMKVLSFISMPEKPLEFFFSPPLNRTKAMLRWK